MTEEELHDLRVGYGLFMTLTILTSLYVCGVIGYFGLALARLF